MSKAKSISIVMNATSVKAIAAKATALEIAHGTAYKDIASLLCAGLEHGANSVHVAEYERRRDAVAALIDNKAHRTNFMRNILVATADLRPWLQPDTLTVEQKAKEAAADKKYKQRQAITIKEKNPTFTDKEVKAAAAAALAAKKAVTRDDKSYERESARAIAALEALAANAAKTLKGDPRNYMAAVAALIIMIKADK